MAMDLTWSKAFFSASTEPMSGLDAPLRTAMPIADRGSYTAPRRNISSRMNFKASAVFYQIGIEPVRIAACRCHFEGVSTPVLSWADVQAAKAASDRKRDRDDLRKAKHVRKRNSAANRARACSPYREFMEITDAGRCRHSCPGAA